MEQPASHPPRENDDYEAASKSLEQEWDYGNKRRKNRSKMPRVPIWAIILVVLIVAGGVGYLVLGRSNKAAKTTSQTTTSQSTQPKPKSSGTASSAQHYVSNGKDLNLEFDYPGDWTVTPASGNNTSDQAITLNTPSTTIASADGADTTGKVTVSIRPGSAQISELSSNSPTAAQDAVQFAYAHPTTSQHQYPYLSFIHFSNASKVAGSFEEVMITGVTPIAKGTQVTPGGLGNLDPIISASFYKCSTTECSGQGAGYLSITNGTWQNTAIFKQVQALFASLKLN